jgi:hypothetical protein
VPFNRAPPSGRGPPPRSAAVPATTLLDVSVVDLFGLGRIAFPD